ncbi:hypothetical protein ABEV54_15615 [Peribacillus psychrosaccharolyticus]|uniref:hypothetical protein n=1 Tax=Peribacillus psychrosaccharolyticus TaxID=1407 RepID=UPI003D2AAC0C
MKVDYAAFQKKKEKEYSNFFCSLIIFLTQTIEELMNGESTPVKVRKQLELNVVTSISLLWNMYMIMFTKNTSHQRLRSQIFIQVFDEKYSRTLQPLIQQFIKDIENYHFINKDHKLQTVKMLEQINQYHLLCSYDNNSINIDAQPPAPWLANRVYN